MAETLTKPSTNSPDASGDRDRSRGRSSPAQENLQGMEKVFIPYEGFLGTSAVKEQLRESVAQPVQTAPDDLAAETSYLDALLGTSMLEPPIERHAEIMSDPRFFHPANAPTSSRIVNRLHQTYGNSHVQTVVDQVQAIQDEGLSGEEVPADIERTIARKRGAGKHLESGTRTQMESLLGRDFSDVSIHTDSAADSLARALQAKAFTVGSDVFFREGAYQPGSESGKKLLGHELTHVVQQSYVADSHRLKNTSFSLQRQGLPKRTRTARSSVLARKFWSWLHSATPRQHERAILAQLKRLSRSELTSLEKAYGQPERPGGEWKPYLLRDDIKSKLPNGKKIASWIQKRSELAPRPTEAEARTILKELIKKRGEKAWPPHLRKVSSERLEDPSLWPSRVKGPRGAIILGGNPLVVRKIQFWGRWVIQHLNYLYGKGIVTPPPKNTLPRTTRDKSRYGDLILFWEVDRKMTNRMAQIEKGYKKPTLLGFPLTPAEKRARVEAVKRLLPQWKQFRLLFDKTPGKTSNYMKKLINNKIRQLEADLKTYGRGGVQRAAASSQGARESKPDAGLQRRPVGQAGSSNAIQRAPDAKGGKPEPKGAGLLRMRKSEPDQAQEVKRKGQSLLTPSPELCEELARKWALTWLIMQKFPEPEEPVLNQLVNALKGKVSKWAPKGQSYLKDPARADEAARTEAVTSVLKQLAKGKPEEKEALSEKEMKEAKEKLSEALTKALDSTKFFPKWKKNIGEKAKEHWPMLAIAGAGLVGGLVAQATQTGKWGNVATLAEQLPSLVDTTIDIDEHWKLVIALKESTPIGKEKGATVIAIKPALGLQYKFDDGKTIELSGTANFRFATETAAPFRMRHEAFFGLGGTW